MKPCLLRYFWNILIAIDQLFNTLLNGSPKATVSGRMGARIRDGKATKLEKWLCMLLSKLDWSSTEHCIESIDDSEDHY